MNESQMVDRPAEGAIGSASSTASRIPLAARPAYALAVLSGLLYFLAFPGIDVWPLSFVALLPLFIALQGQSVRRSFGLGWAAGFTMTMTGFYWLLEMLKTFSGFPTVVCLFFMAVLCAYQGGRIGLMGFLFGRAAARGWPARTAFCLAFATSELVFPLLFPWYFGATVHQVPALTQTAELGSPILVGLVLIAANLALAEPILARLEGRRPSVRLAVALASVPLLGALYGAIRIPQVEASVEAAPKARVGLVQANMSLIGKRRDKAEGLRRHVNLTRELQKEGPLDLVVWSETSVTGAVRESSYERDYPRHFTSQLGVPAIFGAVLVRQVPDAREYVLFNSALISNTEGRIGGRYDKTYLLAFGEYLPFGELFPILYTWSPNSGRFTPGTSVTALPHGPYRVNVHICYEDVIPAFVNRMMRADPAHLLVNITNDAWFGDTTEPWIHLALAKFRAIEQRRFLVRSTNSGVSAVIDPVGRVTRHTGTFRQEAIADRIAWLSGGTAYRLWGDLPWWIAAVASVGMAFVSRPRRRSA